MFRTIQDSEGHHLTHNVRPIQPLGNRDVYFVTSFNDENDSPVNSKDASKSKFLETNTRSNGDYNDNSNNNVQSIHMTVDQEHSIDTIETTTVYQKKLSKLGRNKSISVSFTNFLLLLSTVLTTTLDLKSI